MTAAAVASVSGADSAGILVVKSKKTFASHAGTSELPEQLDAVQEKLGEGPCVEAALNAMVVRSDDFRTEPRWPNFARAAVDAGVHSSMSFQLYTQRDSMGALNLFSFTPHGFGVEDEAIAEALAAHAAMALSAARHHEQFRSALASRDIIGQAKGMIMERFAVDAVRAFEMLATLSQDSNTSLTVVAEKLVALGPEPRS
ncbi:GAF and ANTAR domain-containing protein [Rhodococcus sp. NPDC056960]|uniref:GAF and ANTAR domain-containing protein n=1 Tax=Rhodococcus sp. NPDC056960 TaxID=3345982 RepID=UPI00362A4FAC